MAINTHQGVNIDGGWIIYRNSINAFRTVLTGLDTSAIVFSMEFYTPDGSVAKLTLTEAGGAITNDDAGTIDYSLSVANLVTLPRDRYFFVIKYTSAGNTYPLAQGYTNITSETNPGTTLTSVTIPVSVNSTQINMAVTLTGGGGASTAGDVSFTPAGNLTSENVQAALEELDGLIDIDTVSITAATVLDDTAFGKIHDCTGTSADYNLTLPTPGATNYGKTLGVKGGSTSGLTKVVTLIGTVDGEIDVRQIGANGYYLLRSTSSGYRVISEVGSWIQWTTILTGYSANPTIESARYFRLGKKCTIMYSESVAGTSSATTKTMTAPFTSLNANGISSIVIEVAGTTGSTPGQAQTRANSNVIDLFRTWANAGSTWASSGTARIKRMVLSFEVA